MNVGFEVLLVFINVHLLDFRVVLLDSLTLNKCISFDVLDRPMHVVGYMCMLTENVSSEYPWMNKCPRIPQCSIITVHLICVSFKSSGIHT